MNILGISCFYHDAAAVIICDKEIIAAVEEERFTRKKHDSRFPVESIKYCLEQANLAPENIDKVCFYEKPLLKFERMLTLGKQWKDHSDVMVNTQLTQALNERLFISEILEKELGIKAPLEFSEHHLSHAASSYYISDFDDAVILTVDGVGEWTTTAEYHAKGNKLTKQREIKYPHSLGLLYSAITAYLGFKVNNDEYKVMGLASYGDPVYKDQILKLINLHDDGSFTLNLDYFQFMYSTEKMYSEELLTDLFGPPRVPESEIDKRHMDIASSAQEVLEEAMIKMVNSAYNRHGNTKNLCLAGGVALNCVSNQRILKETPFESISIQPAAGDGGGAMGAALYSTWHDSTEPRPNKLHSTLLGPEFSNENIKEFLEDEDADYTEFDEDGICKKTAELIKANQIIAWYQGKMEYGPRALGNRSIVANACNPEMKDIINARVKFREDFRPFAPAVLEEKASEYFDVDAPSPYMLFTPQVQPQKGDVIPSVTHTDNTARVQTVAKENNPLFYKLIRKFEEISGVPVVINTSFNIRGEPIICTPKEAYECFLKTDIDFLIMGNFLVEKEI